jgi:hypothetical protein
MQHLGSRAFERRATEATDPELRQSYQEIANTWRHLAASYQFSESVERFLLDLDLTKKLPAPSIAAEIVPAKKETA